MATSRKTGSAKKRVKIKELPASKRGVKKLTKPQMRGVVGGWVDISSWDEPALGAVSTPIKPKTPKPRP